MSYGVANDVDATVERKEEAVKKAPPVIDPEARRLFDSDAGDPRTWQGTAREFALHANYLLDWYNPPGSKGFKFTLRGYAIPMMVLFGVAVENLLKALLVAQGTTDHP